MSAPTAGEDQAQQSPGFFMKSTISSISWKFPSVKNLETSELDEWLNNSSERTVVLLDCRPEEEYEVSHLKGAKRVNFEDKDVEELVKEVLTLLKDKPNPTIVCYCSVGYRSSIVAKKIQEYFENSGQQPPEIYNLSGSLFKWANEGRHMVDASNQPTKFAHPYSSVWGKLLNADLRKSS